MVTSIDVTSTDQKLSYDASELASDSKVPASVTRNGIRKLPENGLKIRNGNHSSCSKVSCDDEAETVAAEKLISHPTDEKYDDLNSRDFCGNYLIINFITKIK